MRACFRLSKLLALRFIYWTRWWFFIYRRLLGNGLLFFLNFRRFGIILILFQEKLSDFFLQLVDPFTRIFFSNYVLLAFLIHFSFDHFRKLVRYLLGWRQIDITQSFSSFLFKRFMDAYFGNNFLPLSVVLNVNCQIVVFVSYVSRRLDRKNGVVEHSCVYFLNARTLKDKIWFLSPFYFWLRRALVWGRGRTRILWNFLDIILIINLNFFIFVFYYLRGLRFQLQTAFLFRIDDLSLWSNGLFLCIFRNMFWSRFAFGHVHGWNFKTLS